ncbi:MAG: 16S rRNA (uracil(1498)-N(3))-methyltransferase [Saprospiraceae bacterium]|jgi:16S rRNA (uracil1498-N3)-methyltransferase|nr:16S rRNA (uracil(1498)-N(3))-methyltransferase [Saprospiraceae bacterium]
MQLFYTTRQEGDFLFIEGEEAHHCVNVLRHSIGDQINVTNGAGSMFVCSIIDKSKAFVRLKIEKETKSSFSVHSLLGIAIAPTKNIDRFEWFVEKATEIGVGRIIPIISKRSERTVIKPERLQKLAIAAMKQSNHNFLPEIAPLTKFDDMIKSELKDINLIAHCVSEELPHFSKFVKPNKSILICIGPEGDFTEQEISIAENNRFIGVSLGKSRLRTETAGIYACIGFHQALL